MSEIASPAVPASPLRVYRQALGIRMQDAAEMAGISERALGSLERGESQPRLSTANALAEALGVSISTLFSEVSDA